MTQASQERRRPFIHEPYRDGPIFRIKTICEGCSVTTVGNADDVRDWEATHDCPNNPADQ